MRKNTSTKRIEINLEQCSVVAVTVAIRKQRQRKFRVGYLQNRIRQFSNLTYARPRLMFTLVFSYKRSTHHMKRQQWMNIKEIKKKRRKNQNSRENKSALVKKSAELFEFNFHRSLLIPFLTL